MGYEKLSDSEIISIFEYRNDYNGYIDDELYNRYLLAIRKEEEKICTIQTKK